MSASISYILILVIVLIGAVGTIMIGFSKSNRVGNPDYDRKTSKNLSKLTLYYVLFIVLAIIAFIWYIAR